MEVCSKMCIRDRLQSNLFGQTALVHLQLRDDNDNGTARVVNTFAQQVLAEAALDVYKRQTSTRRRVR